MLAGKFEGALFCDKYILSRTVSFDSTLVGLVGTTSTSNFPVVYGYTIFWVDLFTYVISMLVMAAIGITRENNGWPTQLGVVHRLRHESWERVVITFLTLCIKL